MGALEDLTAIYESESRKVAKPYNEVQISSQILAIFIERTGCASVEDLEREYNKMFPDSKPIKIIEMR